MSLSFSGGVGGGVCMLHTLACCIVSGEEVLINIGLVLDMSNGTSEEEYDEEEEDWGEMVLAVAVPGWTGCKRWNGGCVIDVVGTWGVPAEGSWKGLTGLRSGDSGYFVVWWCWSKLLVFWLCCCNEVKFEAALTMAAKLLGDGKLPGVPPVDEAELSFPPPLWSSFPQPHGQ